MNEKSGAREAARIGLVERARAGNAAAFDALAEAYHSKVFALCLRWTHNAADAEDLAQETLLKAHCGLPRLADPSRFSAWLSRIAVNTCRNWMARERFDTLALETAEYREIASTESDALLQAAVRTALDALPEGLRRAATLFYIEGYTRDELAILWQLPPSTIKGRLDAARRQMRKELYKMGVGTETKGDETIIENGLVSQKNGDMIRYTLMMRSCLGGSALRERRPSEVTVTMFSMRTPNRPGR